MNYKLRIKITMLMLLIISSVAMAQKSNSVTLNLKSVPIKTLFDQIQRQTGISFVYSSDDIKSMPLVSVQANKESVDKVLTRVLKGSNFSFKIKNNIITVKKDSKTMSKTMSKTEGNDGIQTIFGRVTDSDGTPLPGVSIILKGSEPLVGCATDAEGNYKIDAPVGNQNTLVFSYVGMEPLEMACKGKTKINVSLKDDIAMLKGAEVTGNGMFQRRTETFTGSAVTYSGDQLKIAGSQNVIASLKNLDPSFIVVESVDFGSDPNRMPDISIRGQSSIDLRGDYETSPNQPLFILNGFETSLDKVVDMDMNLVASITILKDAAAKAIYGSKAANGVVVIETVQPKNGKLRVSYNASLDVTAPDLTSYHLTNAAEKLQAEVLAGKYTSPYNAYTQDQLTNQYNQLYYEVARGVDSYWMSQPLRVGVGQKHSVMIDGGDNAMLYSANISYNGVTGAMKGSDRNTIGGNVTLSYRVKDFIFRNMLSVDANTAINSPYGDFSQYSAMNPYWRMHDENGKLIKQYSDGSYNPLFNSTLNSKDQSRYNLITENFYAEWNLLPTLKLTGRVGYRTQTSKSDNFIPAENTRYANILPSSAEYINRGEYNQGHGQSHTISADLGANYSISKNNHLLFTNIAYSIEESRNETESFTAIGFPSDRMDFISFGNGYAEGGKPTGSESTTRNLGIIGSLNYSYADRYLADVSYRLNASSMFGAKNKWGNFWAAGIGWNLHHENWLKDSKVINYMKIRATIGYTGSQNFNSYQALSTYNYITDKTYNGDMGVYLVALANENLKWQRQLDRTIGIDFTLFNRLSGRIDYYDDLTDNLLTDITLAPSSGFNTIKENLGKTDNRGFEMTLNYRAFSIPHTRSSLNLFWSLSHNTNKISEISNALKAYNKSQDDAKNEYAGSEEAKAAQRKVSTRYEEGQSLTAIWAVKSAGIDPVTGKEVFIKKDGTTTYEWNSNDQVVCGDATPKFQGNFGLSLRWQGFDLNAAFTYKMGGQTYNSTLVEKVENVDVKNNNVDIRVLTDRWNTPGVPAKYKSISDTSVTKPTSRFVEDYSELCFSAITMGYDFSGYNFVKNSFLEYLKVSCTMNDVAWLSTVKKEFGLSYPRARVFSFSLSARF